MTAFLSSKNMNTAVNGVREMKAPKHFLPEMLSKMIICSLESPDEDREHVSTLINTLQMEGLVTGENFMQVCIHFVPCEIHPHSILTETGTHRFL